MEAKDKLVIGGVILIILLNVITLAFLMDNGKVTGAAVTDDEDKTTAGIVITGELAEDSGLVKCCDLDGDKACYSASESCTSCSSACNK